MTIERLQSYNQYLTEHNAKDIKAFSNEHFSDNIYFSICGKLKHIFL